MGENLHVGAEIRAARLARGWSAAKLARAADMAEATLRAIEAGEDHRIDSLRRAAAALGLSVDVRTRPATDGGKPCP